MKLRFTTSALLSAIAFAAVVLGGVLGWNEIFRGSPDPIPVELVLPNILIFSPLWLFTVFLAYAIGRKSMNLRIVIAFAVAEATAVGISSRQLSRM